MNKKSLFGVLSLLAATVMGVANLSAAEKINPGQSKGNSMHDTGDLSTKVADSIVGAPASRGTAATPAREAPGTQKSVKELQDEFLKLKLGMFIHRK